MMLIKHLLIPFPPITVKNLLQKLTSPPGKNHTRSISM